ncbi:MAG: zinc-dependent metalloprotease, partial [Actinomycetota bacterium]
RRIGGIDFGKFDPAAAQILALAREIIATSLFATPHIAARLEELLNAALVESAASQGNFLEQLQSSDEGVDLEAMLSNPEAILERLSTPSQRWVSTQLSSLVAALEATVDRFTLAVAERMLGTGSPAMEAYRRARASYGSGVEAACSVFSIDSSQEQTERGTRFVDGVIERSSLEQLLDLVRRADGLPTPAEVDAPGLWLERLSLATPE